MICAESCVLSLKSVIEGEREVFNSMFDSDDVCVDFYQAAITYDTILSLEYVLRFVEGNLDKFKEEF